MLLMKITLLTEFEHIKERKQVNLLNISFVLLKHVPTRIKC